MNNINVKEVLDISSICVKSPPNIFLIRESSITLPIALNFRYNSLLAIDTLKEVINHKILWKGDFGWADLAMTKLANSQFNTMFYMFFQRNSNPEFRSHEVLVVILLLFTKLNDSTSTFPSIFHILLLLCQRLPGIHLYLEYL